MPTKVSKDEALTDIQRVTDKLGEPPSIQQYREHGQYSVPTCAKHYNGSFVKAREAAGVSNGRLPEISLNDLLTDIQNVADETGGEPSRDDYHDHGEYALSTITYRFDSWIDAKKEAGVGNGIRTISKQEMVRDIRSTAEEADGFLSQQKYRESGEYSVRASQNRFGSWEDACLEAGIERPDMGPKRVSDQEVLDDILRVKEKIGRPPAKTHYNQHGKYSYGIARTRFGTWMNAIQKAGINDYQPQAKELNPNWVDGKTDYRHHLFMENREPTIQRDNEECQHCGMTREEHYEEYGWDLEVHHVRRPRNIDSESKAHSMPNLITLCRRHHRMHEKWRPLLNREK